MKDDATRAAEVLADHRASIDRLDAILVYTLGRTLCPYPGRGQIEGGP